MDFFYLTRHRVDCGPTQIHTRGRPVNLRRMIQNALDNYQEAWTSLLLKGPLPNVVSGLAWIPPKAPGNDSLRIAQCT